MDAKKIREGNCQEFYTQLNYYSKIRLRKDFWEEQKHKFNQRSLFKELLKNWTQKRVGYNKQQSKQIGKYIGKPKWALATKELFMGKVT